MLIITLMWLLGMASPATPPIRVIRRARGMSLRALAEAAAVSKSHLSRVEQGKATLSLAALLRVARELGLKELEDQLTQYVKEAA